MPKTPPMNLNKVEDWEDVTEDGIYLVRYTTYSEWELHKWEDDRFYYANMSIKKVVGNPMEPLLIYGPLPE